MGTIQTILILSAVCAVSGGCNPQRGNEAGADPQAAGPPRDVAATATAKPQPDLSGRSRTGEASFYAKKFADRKMADGAKMNPHSDNAASRTLPLGTTARVTSLDTGQSADVTIEDRGPFVDGRIVDLSPATARKIGITPANGTAKVTVAPISVPLPDGGAKPGAAAADAKP
jgi:rare lipoprotein A